MKRITSERAIGEWLKRYFKKYNAKFIKLNPATAIGIPDRMALIPNGLVIFFELKSEGASLRPMQVWWKEYLTLNGFNYLIMDHVDDTTEAMLDRCIEEMKHERIRTL